MFDPVKIDTFPTHAGVYVMKSANGNILYIGKAKNVRQRVKQYFAKGGDERAIIPYLVAKIHTIDTIVVPSEKEALLLENTLIKKHQPKYNVCLKDDKSYIALKVSSEHAFPKVEVVRLHGNPKLKGLYFGPYPSAYAARETLDLLHRLFPLRQCSDEEFKRRQRPCILYGMKRCLAPCVQLCTKDAYAEEVKQTIKFLQGDCKFVLEALKEKMRLLSEDLEFEKAQHVLESIRFIEKTITKQHVDKPIGEDADVLGIFRHADEAAISQLFFRNGTLLSFRHYLFDHVIENDEELIEAFLIQNYEKKETLPPLILLPLPLSQKETLTDLLNASRLKKVTLNYPQRGEKTALLNIASMNAEAFYRKEKDKKHLLENTLGDVQKQLHLTHFPSRIECFDTSHFAGDSQVASLVTFIDGKRAPKDYRSYIMRSSTGGDDYGAMREALFRRLSKGKEENHFPDLLIVDGGKGHLNAALLLLKEMDIVSIDVVGLAKEESRHDKGLSQEQVFLPGRKDPLLLKRNSPALFLLQQIRDEAHRRAISHHRKKQSKRTLSSSLDQLPGLGKQTRIKLLKHFGSLKRIKEASEDDLKQVAGLSEKQRQTLLNLKLS